MNRTGLPNNGRAAGGGRTSIRWPRPICACGRTDDRSGRVLLWTDSAASEAASSSSDCLLTGTGPTTPCAGSGGVGNCGFALIKPTRARVGSLIVRKFRCFDSTPIKPHSGNQPKTTGGASSGGNKQEPACRLFIKLAGFPWNDPLPRRNASGVYVQMIVGSYDTNDVAQTRMRQSATYSTLHMLPGHINLDENKNGYSCVCSTWAKVNSCLKSRKSRIFQITTEFRNIDVSAYQNLLLRL